MLTIYATKSCYLIKVYVEQLAHNVQWWYNADVYGLYRTYSCNVEQDTFEYYKMSTLSISQVNSVGRFYLFILSWENRADAS